MDDFERLRQVLHQHPAGAPQSQHFDEILRILFTPNEVRVALAMGFAPRTVQKIARTAGVSQAEAHERCESMANKGIIFGREKDGEMGYALLPTIPGIFEFPFMAGAGTPTHERLGRLWEAYHHEALGNEFAGSSTPLTRVIPIEQTIVPRIEVLPYETLSRLMDQKDTFALAHCACRVSVGACDQPRDVCLLFDSTAEFLIERQLARRITRAEAKDALLRSEEAGLVHTTNNSQDRVNFVCNCCPCCCTILRGLTQLDNPNAFATSRWHAHVDADLCLGCGTCEDERCPVHAVEVVDAVAAVDVGRSIGCGLCATTCEAEAISLTLRTPPLPVTPANPLQLGMQVAAEKGRLEGFRNLLAR